MMNSPRENITETIFINCPNISIEHAEQAADAVIRLLGLRPKTRWYSWEPSRWVTEWIVDE